MQEALAARPAAAAAAPPPPSDAVLDALRSDNAKLVRDLSLSQTLSLSLFLYLSTNA
jgi:hypothetical protein